MFIINLHIINIVRKFHAQKIVSILLCIAMIPKLPIIRMSLLQLTHITAIREEAKRTDLTV